MEEAQALKVGDMVKYRNSTTETLEVVTKEWAYRGGSTCSIEVRTIVVLLDEENRCDVGDEGWINGHNVECFEKVA